MIKEYVCQNCGNKGPPKKNKVGLLKLIGYFFLGIMLLAIFPLLVFAIIPIYWHHEKRNRCQLCDSYDLWVIDGEKLIKDTPVLFEKISKLTEEIKKVISQTYSEHNEKNRLKALRIDSLKNKTLFKPITVKILGGTGYENFINEEYLFSLDSMRLYFIKVDKNEEMSILISDISGYEVSGPGTVSRNAGIIGGGIGVEGAATGILAATLINALTTNVSTKTIIDFWSKDFEVLFITSDVEPDEAKMMLSRVKMIIETNKTKTVSDTPKFIADEIEKLHRLKELGVITTEDFIKSKNKLIE